MRQQQSIMRFDPRNGEDKPHPSHAEQWRHWHGKMTAWLFNPWTGERRTAEDVGSDIFGHLIIPDDENVYAEKEQVKLIVELRLAIPIVREYARKNPIYHDGKNTQDPNGAHSWLNRNEHT